MRVLRLLLPSICATSLVSACGAPGDGATASCLDADAEPGTLCTVVGKLGIASLSPDGVRAAGAELYLPVDTTLGPDGRLYVMDWNNHRIRRVELDGTIQTLAGNGTLGDGPEGPALSASFNHPTNVAFHPDDPDLLYIAAWHNSRIETLDLIDGTLTFIAGDGDRAYGGDGGPATDAILDLPSSLVFDDDGAILLSDTANQIIRRIDPDGTITTFAGTAPPGLLSNGQTDRRFGWEGDGGQASAATFNFGWGQRGYPGGRIAKMGRTLLVADSYNFVVRKIDLDTGVVEHVAGTGLIPGYGGDGGPAATAPLAFPADVAGDEDGNIYIADTLNHCVRRVDAAGTIDVVAGVCGEAGADGDDGPATSAHLLSPFGVNVGDGVLYIADTENHAIRAMRID
ncbi:MAG: hypothetical protein H6733_07175 [Alphaproteobacteria bacterium]|nr:hypothetical protein [Alphaproteobacteria bacterium]